MPNATRLKVACISFVPYVMVLLRLKDSESTQKVLQGSKTMPREFLGGYEERKIKVFP